jgi:hypothetical protein
MLHHKDLLSVAFGSFGRYLRQNKSKKTNMLDEEDLKVAVMEASHKFVK